MADHFSGPRALSDPAADVTDVYAFPSPDRPGHLVLVLDVFPAATFTGLFSDAITYRLRLRPVAIRADGPAPAFAVGDEEYKIDFTFAAPFPDDTGDTMAQTGVCTLAGGAKIPFRVNDEQPKEMQGVRIFAGARLEPFFIDLAATQATEAAEELAFKAIGHNAAEGMNVLSMVVEIDAEAVFGPRGGPLLAVVGETGTSGGHPLRIERMGRPEIKNVIMQAKKFDTLNRDLEIRDLYNAEDAFGLSQEYENAYRARLNANLAFFDRLDGKTDWPANDRGEHPLTELLLADYLVVDTSKPFSEDSFLEIERALLAGGVHTTCGGRSPNDDIIDKLYTLLVGGVDGPRISDGVDHATQPATHTFPYLVAPNPNPPDVTAMLASRGL